MTALARYEWTRFITLRSTWVVAVASLVATATITWMVSSAASSGTFNGPRQSWLAICSQGATESMPAVSAFTIALLGVFAWHEDVAGDAVAATLTTLPSRPKVALARFIAIGASTVMMATANEMVAVALGGARVGFVGFASLWPVALRQCLRVIAYVVVLSLVSGGLCVLTRSAVVTTFALLLVPWLIEPVIVTVAYLTPALQAHVDAVRFLPFSAMADLLSRQSATYIGPPRLALPGALAESAAIAGCFSAAAITVFMRRDPLKG